MDSIDALIDCLCGCALGRFRTTIRQPVGGGREMQVKTIADLIPDPGVLLALAPEELAFYLLKLARANIQNGIFHPNSITEPRSRVDLMPGSAHYPAQLADEVELALKEGWHWLEQQALVIPASGTNGTNGHRRLSRRGREFNGLDQFQALAAAAAFPKSLLHPLVADRVWVSLARGELDTAVFFAFRTVEEEVRNAAHLADTEIGMKLMRKAFATHDGPLTDLQQPEGEREALMQMFAGAIGSYKNPHSHRTVTITDPREAQEMVIFASHLLRIVDQRRPSR